MTHFRCRHCRQYQDECVCVPNHPTRQVLIDSSWEATRRAAEHLKTGQSELAVAMLMVAIEQLREALQVAFPRPAGPIQSGLTCSRCQKLVTDCKCNEIGVPLPVVLDAVSNRKAYEEALRATLRYTAVKQAKRRVRRLKGAIGPARGHIEWLDSFYEHHKDNQWTLDRRKAVLQLSKLRRALKLWRDRLAVLNKL